MIHVVIPTAGSLCLTDCILTMVDDWEAHCDQQLRLVLVVNCSDVDVCCELLKMHYKFLRRGLKESRLVMAAERFGYVHAANLGFQLAQPADEDVVILLNDDVTANGDWINPLLAALRMGYAQVGPSLRGVGPDGFWATQPSRYKFVEGWLWAAKAKTIRSAGGLYDPDFSPGYCEDADLSIRIQEAGGKLGGLPTLPVTHARSQTFGGSVNQFWSANRERLKTKWQLGGHASN